MDCCALLRSPSLLLALGFLCLAAAPARAQDAAPVTIVVRVERDPMPDPTPRALRPLEPPIERNQRAMGTSRPEDDAPGVLVSGAFTLGLSLVGLGAVIAEAPAFGDGWPDWAALVFALSAPFSALSLFTIGGGAGLAMGVDDLVPFVVTGAVELALGTLLATAALAIAPGVGAPWADAQAQARTSEILGLEALALSGAGVLALVLGSIGDDDSTERSPVAIAPALSPTRAGVSARLSF